MNKQLEPQLTEHGVPMTAEEFLKFLADSECDDELEIFESESRALDLFDQELRELDELDELDRE